MLGNAANGFTVLLGAAACLLFFYKTVRRLGEIVRLLRSILTLTQEVATLKLGQVEQGLRLSAVERLLARHPTPSEEPHVS
jgi:hypothetical protein